jgi:hypothetical protein
LEKTIKGWRKIQNGGKKSKSKSFFQTLRPKIFQKKLPKKIFQDGGYFQNGVCTFFLNENMSCDRYFRYIVVIFWLSHNFFDV